MEKFVIVFAGDYDIRCREELRAELERVALIPDLILDFAGVTYIDSTCIGELIRLHKMRAESLFKTETIIIQTPNVQRLFDLLELDKVFRIANSSEEALGSGGRPFVTHAFTADGDSRARPFMTPTPPAQFA